nr:hypothetical protein [Tanacetum cinerariifolium]
MAEDSGGEDVLGGDFSESSNVEPPLCLSPGLFKKVNHWELHKNDKSTQPRCFNGLSSPHMVSQNSVYSPLTSGFPPPPSQSIGSAQSSLVADSFGTSQKASPAGPNVFGTDAINGSNHNVPLPHQSDEAQGSVVIELPQRRPREDGTASEDMFVVIPGWFLSSIKINWNFFDRYGYRYGDAIARPLLPLEDSRQVPDVDTSASCIAFQIKDTCNGQRRQGQRQSIVIAFAALELIRTSYGCP